jgi:uncharacterized protein YjbI with pentapeptide repeats
MLAYFSSAQPDPDPNAYMSALRQWYWDEEEQRWHASWNRFRLPSSISFSEQRFGLANLQGVIFRGTTDFTGTVFEEEANFRFARFNGPVSFSKTTFENDAYFLQADFRARPSFRMSHFKGAALFRKASFIDGADLRESIFDQLCSLRACTFLGHADFFLANFRQRLLLRAARFEAQLRCAQAQMGDGIEAMGALFEDNVDFRKSSIRGDVIFTNAQFKKGVTFGQATVLGNADFERTVVRGHSMFGRTRFIGEFVNFARATLHGFANFHEATFNTNLDFGRTRFLGVADFHDSRLSGQCLFVEAQVANRLFLGFSRSNESRIVLSNIGCHPANATNPLPSGAPEIHMGPMPLDGVELRSLDASRARLKHASNIESIVLQDVSWPQTKYGFRLADEDDLRAPSTNPPSAFEVERIYRSLRKNHEDQSDKVGGHRWYFSEMEIGRSTAPIKSLRRLARAFYKHTSQYGLSAIRPFMILIAIALAAVLVYLLPNQLVCPLVEVGDNQLCAGAKTAFRVVALGASFQGQPGDVLLEGPYAQLVWLLLRLAAGTMLLSVGVAFRNQVIR